MQNTDNSLKRKYSFLFYYTIISSTLFLAFILSSFIAKENKITADEITVKRVTVVGEDNLPRVVISNETRQHPGRADGKELPKRSRNAGIIFFNNTGEECGGISFGAKNKNNVIDHSVSMMMDNYRNDQVIVLENEEHYENGNAAINRGLVINEYPAGAAPLMELVDKLHALDSIKDAAAKETAFNTLLEKDGPKRRLFIGRSQDNDNGLFLYDSKGKPKLLLYVDKAGNPKIEVIDSTGHTKNILQ
ncbi:hypothetical protein [Chitinophaga sp. Cy-1792]|uniref:hypothetical protein n=1 Tax=Chitinophaga sp. Cy-1792 TaxID=2608339 RepID=UPI00142463C5|nr:hypothetical protein [Chitinophaga sp. Cy-1792]NIG53973.1 hypothetical protein [Chitinophaga sp. Cy-1792]